MTRATPMLIILLSAETAHGQSIITQAKSPFMVELLLAMVAILVVVAIVLQRSRAKHKQAEHELEQARKELQFLVVQRTRRLNELNQALQNEIRLQEHTSRSLQSANDLLDSILTCMPSMLVAVTPDGNVTHWNKASELLTGIDESQALNKNLLELCPDLPVSWSTIHDTIARLVPSSDENIGWMGIYCDVAVYPLLGGGAKGAVLRIDDVTTRTTVETMLIHNEKMMSLGEMAAGTAHEVNNPLATILQNVQNTERRLFGRLKGNLSAAEKVGLDLSVLQAYLEERDIQRMFNDIRNAGERATEIVTNMLAFSRRSSTEFEDVDLCELVNNTLVLARQNSAAKGKQRDKVKLTTHFEDSPVIVECLATEIQQVLLNLITNAEQALQGFEPPEGRRMITISVRADESTATLEVKDNGPGIPSEQRRHVFEPFYTTKTVGNGTGLGLSVSYFIITKHHSGNIMLEPARGGGCVFIVTLPKQQTDTKPLEVSAHVG
jgi:two-component system, NtrC family, sensor kinase